MRITRYIFKFIFIYYLCNVLISPSQSLHRYNPDFHVFFGDRPVKCKRIMHLFDSASLDMWMPGTGISLQGILNSYAPCCMNEIPSGFGSRLVLIETSRLIL